MDLGLFNVSDTYQYVLNQSGANAITLGNGTTVNWNAGGVVALTGNQSISGEKYFNNNIGIGTNTPLSTLDVRGSITNYVGTAGNQTILQNWGWGNAIARWKPVIESNANFAFYGYDSAGNSPAARITISNSDGNVGIGTSSPTQTLHVTGSIYANSFTGNSFIGNSFTLQNTGIKLLSPVSLTTANIWYDVTGLSGALSSGTWLVNAMALYSGSATASNAAFRVLNSTSGTVYASAMNFHTASISDLSTTNISTIINLTSTTTVKLQALSSSISANIIASGTGLANSGSCSQISFVKIS